MGSHSAAQLTVIHHFSPDLYEPPHPPTPPTQAWPHVHVWAALRNVQLIDSRRGMGKKRRWEKEGWRVEINIRGALGWIAGVCEELEEDGRRAGSEMRLKDKKGREDAGDP